MNNKQSIFKVCSVGPVPNSASWHTDKRSPRRVKACSSSSPSPSSDGPCKSSSFSVRSLRVGRLQHSLVAMVLRTCAGVVGLVAHNFPLNATGIGWSPLRGLRNIRTERWQQVVEKRTVERLGTIILLPIKSFKRIQEQSHLPPLQYLQYTLLQSAIWRKAIARRVANGVWAPLETKELSASCWTRIGQGDRTTPSNITRGPWMPQSSLFGQETLIEADSHHQQKLRQPQKKESSVFTTTLHPPWSTLELEASIPRQSSPLLLTSIPTANQ